MQRAQTHPGEVGTISILRFIRRNTSSTARTRSPSDVSGYAGALHRVLSDIRLASNDFHVVRALPDVIGLISWLESASAAAFPNELALAFARPEYLCEWRFIKFP